MFHWLSATFKDNLQYEYHLYPKQYQGIRAHNLPSWRNCLGEPGCFHCLDCCLDSRVKWLTHVSSKPRHKPQQKLARIRLKKVQVSTHIFCLVCFWSTVRSLGTQRAESFLISRSFIRMELTLLCDFPTALAISLAVTSLSPIIMPPTAKKLEGHIASRTFVRSPVRASVRYAFYTPPPNSGGE